MNVPQKEDRANPDEPPMTNSQPPENADVPRIEIPRPLPETAVTQRKFQTLDLEKAIFGRSHEETLGAKLREFGIFYDLTSEEGRAGTIAALRSAAIVAKKNLGPSESKVLLQLIAGLVAEVQRLGEEPDEASIQNPEVMAANIFARHAAWLLNTVNLFIVKGDPAGWDSPASDMIKELYGRWVEDLRALSDQDFLIVNLGQRTE